ncbi:M16 family metallopeptidase [Oscillatoria salina]|uniref:M16 family metallopeptidase n=1 Tax=Oscillatoria salina TaxID=331517 RepID=UPI001CCBE71F|nr:pitrilysin family protein [Oscillatoria salina]MBZ8178759.1 insulinase family protein [Oscillatoria salina IIICB1]
MIENKKRKSIRLLGIALMTMLLTFVSGGIISLPNSFLSTLSPAIAATAQHYTELDFPPLSEVKIPDYDRYQLPNGMVVYLMEDHELPLVSGMALIHTGSRLEPADKVGLAELTGAVMRSGGTLEYSPDELNQMLEQRAASVETGIGTTAGNASFSALSEDLPTVFKLFSKVLREPAFAPDKLELAKNQMRGGIARRNDNPGDIASREFRKLIYGPMSPYARTVEYATLDNIQRNDLIAFYQKYFRPDNMILGIVGDFDSEEMKALIAENFGDWRSPANVGLPEVPDASQQQTGGVFVVDRPELTQSNILLGHLGGKLINPDYPELDVLNGVVNGFGGRLFNEVRSRQGLAYSVYGFWSPRYDYDGIFVAGGQTRSDATVPFVQAIVSELQKLRQEPPTEAELEYAKESILNSFVFNFQDPSQTLSRLMRYEYYDYPSDYIFQYQQQVKATTREDVLRVAKEYLAPEKIVVLVVGNQSQMQPPLSSLGTQVQTVDVSIPSPPSS